MTDAASNPYANPVTAAPPLGPAEEKQFAILTHVVSIFFGVVAAGIFYFLFRERGPFVRAHTVTEWNFQLTLLIAEVCGFALSFTSIFASIGLSAASQGGPPVGLPFFVVGYFLILALRIVGVVFGIIAAVAASRGNYYRYPLAIRFR